MNTGVAPQYRIALAVATNVSVEVTTRSPGFDTQHLQCQVDSRRAAAQRNGMR